MKKQCKKCENSFDNEKDLRNHDRTVHAKKASCLRCGKVFQNKRNLDHHLVKNVPCDWICRICGENKVNRKKYYTHMTRVHGQKTKKETEMLEYEKEMEEQPQRNVTYITNNYGDGNNIINNFYQITIDGNTFSLMLSDVSGSLLKDGSHDMLKLLGKSQAEILDSNADVERAALKVIARICADSKHPRNSIFNVQSVETFDTKIKHADGHWEDKTFDETHETLEALSLDLLERCMIEGHANLVPGIYTKHNEKMYALSIKINPETIVIIYYGWEIKLNGEFDKNSEKEIRTRVANQYDVIKKVQPNADFTLFMQLVKEKKDFVIAAIKTMTVSREGTKNLLKETQKTCLNNAMMPHDVQELDLIDGLAELKKKEPEYDFGSCEDKHLLMQILIYYVTDAGYKNGQDNKEVFQKQRLFMDQAMENDFCRKAIVSFFLPNFRRGRYRLGNGELHDLNLLCTSYSNDQLSKFKRDLDAQKIKYNL